MTAPALLPVTRADAALLRALASLAAHCPPQRRGAHLAAGAEALAARIEAAVGTRTEVER